MRAEKQLTLDEIAERLALSKTTVWYWISDLPAPPRRATAGQRLGTEAMQRKYRLLRENAYAAGCDEFDALCEEPTFRDFVVLYIAEGYKRSRNVVNIESAAIRLQRKSNSTQLQRRTWRSEHGVLAITTSDTSFRARMQGWIDCIRAEWL
jgi:transcriptional regulator with XRE-family HTH domain